MTFFNRGNNSFRISKFIGIFLFFILAVLLLGYVVMFLWNAILPPVLHVGTITYWQGMGLLVLCRLLFGNFGGGRSHRPPFGKKAQQMKEKWMNMSEEERQQFKEQWHRRGKSDI